MMIHAVFFSSDRKLISFLRICAVLINFCLFRQSKAKLAATWHQLVSNFFPMGAQLQAGMIA
jgi:hypothetical protein